MVKRSVLFQTVSVAATITVLSILIVPNLVWSQDMIIRGTSAAGISYMTGGVGLEERGVMKKESKNYSLWLEFAIKAGNFLSGAEVVIKDAQGKVVVQEKAAGPWFMASLPAGKYMVSAKVGAQTSMQHVEVPAKKKITFIWK